MKGRFGRRRAALGALLAFGLLAAACGDDGGDSGAEPADSTGTTGTSGSGGTGASGSTASAGTPVAGGTATIQLFSEIATLDPVKATGSAGSDGQRFFANYGALLVLQNGKISGLQAEYFKSTSADNKTWELKVKPNQKFVDGTPYDAAAVKANWDRCKVPENASPARGVCAFFAKVEVSATDPLVLTVTNASSNAHLDKAVERTNLNYIASKKAIDDKTDMTQKSVGAGPFVLDEWVRDSRMVMSKNKDWNASTVYLDKLILQTQSVEQQRIDTFNTGASDAFYTATPGSIDAATKGVKGSYVTTVALTTGQTFVLNNAKAPFDDVRIRKAVIQAIPIDVLAKDILNGSEPAVYFSVPGSPFHSENSKLPAYSLTEAQKNIDAYVAEKGGPVKFTMLVFQQQLDQDRAKFILSQFQKLKNIQVELQINDSPTNIGKVLGGDYQWSSWGFPTIDGEPGLWNQAHSSSATAINPFNYSKYANADVDKWLDEARASSDDALRNANYKKVVEQLAKDVPYFPYIVSKNNFVCSPKLQGCELYEDGILRFDKLWKKA